MIGRLLVGLLLLGSAVQVRAAGLEVVPILLEIAPATPRGSLIVRNLADDPIRLELTAHAWGQGPDGRMELSPAPNLVIYPPILEVPPRGERKVRVSATGGFGAMEGSYRVFVNELPRSGRSAAKNTIRFLTRVGIPIFLSPPKKLERLELAGAAVTGGRLAFQLRNTGNTRLYPAKLAVTGLDDAGRAVFSRELDTWYVLAGGHRAFDVAIPKEGCGRVRKLTVELGARKIPVRTGVETPGGACGP